MQRVIQSLKAGWIWLLLGAMAGAFIPANGIRSVLMDLPGLASKAAEPQPAPDDDAHDDHHDHVPLSDIAQRNLGLRTGRVKAALYTRTIQIPGTVRERPALSDLAISSRVQGVVTRIYTTPGQAVRIGKPLFRIRLTGDELAGAQADLLDSLQRIELTDREINRLQGASRSGGVAANKLIKLKADRDMYTLQKKNREQSLMIRGLTAAQVAEISTSKQFIQFVEVGMPAAVQEAAPGTSNESFADGLNFTIEDLHVHPGKAVNAGDELCDVAYHTNLYFEGQAFEKDVEAIRAIAQDGRLVEIEFAEGAAGTGTKGHSHSRLEGLKVLYIDNHVDPETQTFRFYMSIENEVLGDVRDGDVVFRSWRFKPGQRGHVLLPVEQMEGHFPLPREAVLIEGPDAFVFRELDDDAHAHGPDGAHDDDTHNHEHDAHMREFEPVPVEIVFQNENVVVVASGGDLKPGQKIAMNRAYDLQLALKSGDGSSGHAHHGHAH